MKQADLDKAIVAALKALPAGVTTHQALLRREIGCTAAEMKAAVQRLRFKGIIQWGGLKLAASVQSPVQPGAGVTPLPVAPGPDAGAGASDRVDGAAPASLVAQVKADAAEAGARRQTARSGGTAATLAMTPAERVATLMVEEPKDAVALVTRKWPDLWRRVVMLGRAAGTNPPLALFDAIETGVAALEARHG